MNLSDFADLQTAQAHTEVKGRMISPDMMVSFLTAHNLINTVLNSSTDGAKGLQLALQFGSEFNVITGHPASIITIVNQMITDEILTQAFKEFCVSYANPVVYPFANTTLAQFNMAKNIYTAKQITLTKGQDIIVTVNTSLPERVAATVWRVETGFEHENAGRNIHVKDTNKYRIDMSGKKTGEYEVRIPFDNTDFSVEAV